MALNIKIDFKDCYAIQQVNDFKYSTFETELEDGKTTRLGIKINEEEHYLMSNVYNLSFGPIKKIDGVDDVVKLHHKNHSKVFSTIAFEAFTFLNQNPEKILGIDGSNTARAYMYYRCMLNNYDYLTTYFAIYGVNFYARMFRDGHFDTSEEGIHIRPMLLVKGEQISPTNLYNYFIFTRK